MLLLLLLLLLMLMLLLLLLLLSHVGRCTLYLLYYCSASVRLQKAAAATEAAAAIPWKQVCGV
jgi:hypothetical protein